MWSFALVAGLLLAVIFTALMIPLPFPTPQEKRTAMGAAFLERFWHGFIIGPVASGLGANGILVGAVLGLGLSIPTAVITKSYIPVIPLGLHHRIGGRSCTCPRRRTGPSLPGSLPRQP